MIDMCLSARASAFRSPFVLTCAPKDARAALATRLLGRRGVWSRAETSGGRMVGGYGAGTVAASLLFARTTLWGDVPPPATTVNSDGSFLSDWLDDGTTPPCQFFNATHQYVGLCSHFSIARMSIATQYVALDRALTCAAHYETDCVISPEVGLSVPAAFVYDQENGLKMLIAPKILPLDASANSTVKLVGFQDPVAGRSNAQLYLNNTVRVEYMEGGTRRMHIDTVHNSSAYCVQLLRLAFDPVCWNEID